MNDNDKKALDIALPFLRQREGLRLKAYSDQGGRVTIGYGHTGGVSLGDEISEPQAEDFLLADATNALEGVLSLVRVSLTDNQKAALTSFVFNLGINSLRRSGLLRLLNLGKYQAAADQFHLWNHRGMYVDHGLTLRRDLERTLFLS